jgi:ribosomal-protein-alanine N-acetyltransferase
MPDENRPLDDATLNIAFSSARLRMEPLEGRHAPLMFEGLRDPAIYEWIPLAPPSDVESMTARWTRFASRVLSTADVFELGWGVQRIEDGAWIGKVDSEVQAHGVATHVGYIFFPPYRGNGYATEALTALVGHLARHGVVEQRGTIILGNDASARVLERAGFVRSRVFPGDVPLRGAVVDHVEYVRRG